MRNYVPARRLSDNAVGLYDKVSGTFSPSVTGTAFVDGPEIERGGGELRINVAGGTLDLVNGTLRQPVVKAGSGTVPNGTLAVTDSLVVNLSDCIAGNCLAVGGTIDLTGATLVLEDPAVLDTYKSPITFLRTTTGGSIVGEPVCPQLSKGWRISIKDGKARLKKDAFTIFMR